MQIYLQNKENNIEEKLNEKENKILDDMSYFLNTTIKNYNESKIEFNLENFKSFIKKNYIKEEINPHERFEELEKETKTFGYNLGFLRRTRNNENHYEQNNYSNYPSEPNELTDWRTEYDSLSITIFNTYSKREIRKYDFIALVSFFIAFFFIYISYTKYNEISNKIFGNELIDVASNFSNILYSQIKVAINETRQLSSIELTFLQYVWKSISLFTCSIAQQQKKLITNIVYETAQNCINNFTELATNQAYTICTPKTELLSNYQEDTILGQLVGGINSFAQIISTTITIEDTNLCILRQSGSEITNYINKMNYERDILINKISILSSQAIGFLKWGGRLGYPSTIYLTYRIFFYTTKNIIIKK